MRTLNGTDRGGVGLGGGKSCHRCGRDLHQTARFRDRAGYWCYPCHVADRKAFKANHLPCDDCGADVRRGSEIRSGELGLCEVCHQRREVEELRRRMREENLLRRQQRRKQRLWNCRRWGLVAIELVLVGVLVALASGGKERQRAEGGASATRPALQEQSRGGLLARVAGDSQAHAAGYIAP